MRAIDSPSLDRYWLCSLCPSQIVIMEVTKGSNSNTTAAIQHLKAIHKVSFKQELEQDDEEEPEDLAVSSLGPMKSNVNSWECSSFSGVLRQ